MIGDGSRAEENSDRYYEADNNGKHKRTYKCTERISSLPYGNSHGNNLRYSSRKTQRGYHKGKRIYLICISVKAVSLISEKIRQRNTIDNTNHFRNHCSRCQDRPLDDIIIPTGFHFIIPWCIRHVSPPCYRRILIFSIISLCFSSITARSSSSMWS